MIQKRRYQHLVLNAVCACLVGWASNAIHPAAAADVVRVGKAMPQAYQFVPVDIGIQADIFRKQGLDVQPIAFGGSVKLQQALISDGVDIGLSGSTDLSWVAKGTPVIGVAVIAGSPRSLTLVVRPDSTIRSAGDLKGKLVAISATGSLSDWLLRELARQQGWKPEEIRTVGLGAVTSMIAALKTQQVDSIFADLSVVYRLESAGDARRVVNFGDVVPDFYAQVIFATQSFAEKHPDTLRRFLAGWFETIALMRRDKAMTVGASKEVMGIAADGAAWIYDELMPTFSADGIFDPKASQALKRSFVELQLLPTEPEMTALYTEKFLPKNRSK